MGTNFYMFTKDKGLFKDATLVDEPEFGYEIHIAKKSCGWKPLFKAHKDIKSVADYSMLSFYKDVKIYDEYGRDYNWLEFETEVVDWNKDNPEAYSHFTYENGKYANYYFTDKDGYEFSKSELS